MPYAKPRRRREPERCPGRRGIFLVRGGERMRTNVGGVDRLARAAAGPALMAVGYGPLGGRRGRLTGVAAIVVGALLAETAITKTCPLNAALGVDTSRG